MQGGYSKYSPAASYARRKGHGGHAPAWLQANVLSCLTVLGVLLLVLLNVQKFQSASLQSPSSLPAAAGAKGIDKNGFVDVKTTAQSSLSWLGQSSLGTTATTRSATPSSTPSTHGVSTRSLSPAEILSRTLVVYV